MTFQRMDWVTIVGGAYHGLVGRFAVTYKYEKVSYVALIFPDREPGDGRYQLLPFDPEQLRPCVPTEEQEYQWCLARLS